LYTLSIYTHKHTHTLHTKLFAEPMLESILVLGDETHTQMHTHKHIHTQTQTPQHTNASLLNMHTCTTDYSNQCLNRFWFVVTKCTTLISTRRYVCVYVCVCVCVCVRECSRARALVCAYVRVHVHIYIVYLAFSINFPIYTHCPCIKLTAPSTLYLFTSLRYTNNGPCSFAAVNKLTLNRANEFTL